MATDIISAAQLELLLSQLPDYLRHSAITLEEIQNYRAGQREAATRQLDVMAEEFKHQDEKRRKLWGNKFPVHFLDEPPEPIKPAKSVNQVKKTKKKRK